MKRRTLIVYWCLAPLLISAYIVAMASAAAKEDTNPNGPKAYASPNGNAWGLNHGNGKPDKTP